MKMLMLIIATFVSLSTAAYADVCTVAMSDGYRTIRTYRGTGYNRTESCREALRECNRERISYSGYSHYRCETISHSSGGGSSYPYPGTSYESCTYRLQDRYGQTLRTFQASSYYRSQACSDAQGQCQRERDYHTSRGEYGASCVESYY